MITGKGEANGTFGELIQGKTRGEDFLVTLPISLKSEALFIFNPEIDSVISIPNKLKATKAAKLLFNKLNMNEYSKGLLSINSNIPKGKGMASSSADIVATIKAISNTFDIKISNELISQIATDIEPTDGVMYKNPCIYKQRTGKLVKELNELNSFKILGVDCGGEVDTLKYHKQIRSYSKKEEEFFESVISDIDRVFQERDIKKLFEYTTRSALINQNRLPKKHFNYMLKIALAYECGLTIAHSGTVAGILIDKLDINYEIKVENIKSALSKVSEELIDFNIQSKGDKYLCV